MEQITSVTSGLFTRVRKQYKLSGRRLLIWYQTALAQLYCGYVRIQRNYVIDYLLYNMIHGEKQQKQQKQQC